MEPLEIECKFLVTDRESLTKGILSWGGVFLQNETHCDTYLRHPSRDFRVTDEALRIRELNGKPLITYKGPRLPGPVKIRPEIELPLVPHTVESWLSIWQHLGFEIVARVSKVRSVYKIATHERELTITMDCVEGVGEYAEIERVIEDPAAIENAKNDILELAAQLGLGQMEKRSYLSLLLGQ
ncbi:MAG: class IV adenylate cyclase [Pirellula sp.]|jgi:adenylate cyclase class 2|nr:class IV adenylate cyclase [Pirellula sp.]